MEMNSEVIMLVIIVSIFFYSCSFVYIYTHICSTKCHHDMLVICHSVVACMQSLPRLANNQYSIKNTLNSE